MWRPATAQDIGKKCRVRDEVSDEWGERVLVACDGAANYPFVTESSRWRFCEVWDEPKNAIPAETLAIFGGVDSIDSCRPPAPCMGTDHRDEPRTEITWENIKDDDLVRVSNEHGSWVISWKDAIDEFKHRVGIIQPKPKTVITEAMILEKFGLSKSEVEIRLD